MWRDSSAVGPCALDPDTHRRLRAEWWDVAAAEMDLARDLPAEREMVLWFGPDPWEQTALVEVLTGTPATAASRCVVLDDAVGLMDPAVSARALRGPARCRRPSRGDRRRSGGISAPTTAGRSARGWDGFAARRACRIFPPRSTACSRTARMRRTARQVRGAGRSGRQGPARADAASPRARGAQARGRGTAT